MESFAPEKAGLVSELFSRSYSESALEVESALLRESRLDAVESRPALKVSMPSGLCGLMAVSMTTASSDCDTS